MQRHSRNILSNTILRQRQTHMQRLHNVILHMLAPLTLLVLLTTACQSLPGASGSTPTPTPTQRQAAQSQSQRPTPQTTPYVPLYPPATSTPQSQPTPTATEQIRENPGARTHPVLAFYYPWYTQTSWTRSQMSDLPAIQYDSSDDVTIQRQLREAAGAGITGFISSWWGEGDKTDKNFAQLQSDAATLEGQTGYRFASSLYIECDAPNLNRSDKLIQQLSYIKSTYSSNPHFFHWQGKPVLFFWNPLGSGRTLTEWSNIRQQVDPDHQMLWSAEGIDTTLLSIFDGLHLFSAGYWGLQNNTMPAVDQGIRAKIDTYNRQHNTQKIWTAGVMPGYDDTRVPGRKNTFVVPRNNGATYTTSWNAAIASNPSWITITSYNEWFEGAMIEPSVTYGNQYLSLTRQFTAHWQR